MLKITKLKWLCEEGKEAELTVSDGQCECLVFSHPCKYEEGDHIYSPLVIYDSENLRVTVSEEIGISPTTGYFEHFIVGIVIKLDLTVQVGKFIFKINDDFPKDLHIGDVVQFSCSRVDAW